MNNYEMKAYEDVQAWRLKVMKRSGIFNKLSKKAQNKMNIYNPKKVHQVIADSMKYLVNTILVGFKCTTKKKLAITRCLYDQDELLKEKHNAYRKTAVIEGSATRAR